MGNYEEVIAKVKHAGINMADAAEQLNRFMSGLRVNTKDFSLLVKEKTEVSGNKRNGTLDRRQAFGEMFKSY
ncbi:hypothetical protein AB6878_12795 [Carnobacterium maltaromaticum]|uniref:hypothetical protein n=1 Tax=Carnobacterium maltaromaticum TaxID=2751 RepID=UPI0039BE84EC